MDVIIFLLSIPAGIAAWIFLAKSLSTKNNCSKFLSHLAGASLGFLIIVFGLVVAATMSSNKSVSTSEEKENSSQMEETPEKSQRADTQETTLNLTLDDYISQLNATFKKIDSGHKVSKNIKIDSGEVKDTVSISFNDNVSALLSLRKGSRKIQSIMAIWIPNANRSEADNLKDMLALSAIASAVDGNDSLKTVGANVLKTAAAQINKWAKDKDESYSDEFIFNNIKYSINVSSITGVIITIVPAE